MFKIVVGLLFAASTSYYLTHGPADEGETSKQFRNYVGSAGLLLGFSLVAWGFYTLLAD